jgi:hypothetical protein
MRQLASPPSRLCTWPLRASSLSVDVDRPVDSCATTSHLAWLLAPVSTRVHVGRGFDDVDSHGYLTRILLAGFCLSREISLARTGRSRKGVCTCTCERVGHACVHCASCCKYKVDWPVAKLLYVSATRYVFSLHVWNPVLVRILESSTMLGRCESLEPCIDKPVYTETASTVPWISSANSFTILKGTMCTSHRCGFFSQVCASTFCVFHIFWGASTYHEPWANQSDRGRLHV